MKMKGSNGGEFTGERGIKHQVKLYNIYIVIDAFFDFLLNPSRHFVKIGQRECGSLNFQVGMFSFLKVAFPSAFLCIHFKRGCGEHVSYP
jgi:hypothetical protein